MSAENKAIVRRLYEEIINKRNFDTANEIISADYESHRHPLPGQAAGLEGLKQAWVMACTGSQTSGLRWRTYLPKGTESPSVCPMSARIAGRSWASRPLARKPGGRAIQSSGSSAARSWKVGSKGTIWASCDSSVVFLRLDRARAFAANCFFARRLLKPSADETAPR